MPGFIIFLIVLTFAILKRDIKNIVIFLVIGLIIGVPYIKNWWNESNANPFDYARITEVDYKAVVVDEYGSSGKVVITERLTFDIHAASQNNLFWELWRELPEEYVDGVKVEYKVNYVKQILDNRELEYKQSPKLYWNDNDYINTRDGYGPGKWFHSKGPYDGEYNFECVLFYVNGLYRETVVFEIEYEMYNAGLRYADASELYLSLYSGESTKYLKSFKGQILFPNEKMPREGNYEAYTYGTNSHSFPFEESTSKNYGYHTFSFELNESQLKFKPYNQYIEFTLVAHGIDKHLFTQNAARNTYYDDEVLTEINEEQAKYEALPAKWTLIKVVALILFCADTFLVSQYTLSRIKKIKQKYTFYKPEMQIDYFRDIPSELDPNFAATLVFCRHKKTEDIEDGYAAVMLSLVRKGYVELVKIREERDWDNNNTKIVVKYKPMYIQQEGSNGKSNYSLDGSKKACPKCANQNVITAKFCIFCSAPFNDVNNTSPVNIGANIGLADAVAAINPLHIEQPVQQVQEQVPYVEVISDMKQLSPTEEQYFNLILRHSHGVEISVSSFQEKIASDYEYTNSFVKNIKTAITSIGLSQGYIQKDKYKEPKENLRRTAFSLGFIGFLLLTAGNYLSYRTRLDFAYGGTFIFALGFIVSAIYLFKEAKKYVLLTQFGENEYEKWRGLYKFLASETLMNERTVIEIVIWEQYLVYATAFGIAEKVIKALQVRCPSVEISPVLSNPYYRSTHFYTHSRSFRSATRSASYTSRSGGFGYGGGGRGGGGGGGGH